MLDIGSLDFSLGQSLIGFAQVASKGGGAIAMDAAVEPLDFVEGGTHLLPAERRVREKVDEVLDGLLEVDVVFPQGVVAVDDQDLPAPHRCSEDSQLG